MFLDASRIKEQLGVKNVCILVPFPLSLCHQKCLSVVPSMLITALVYHLQASQSNKRDQGLCLRRLADD